MVLAILYTSCPSDHFINFNNHFLPEPVFFSSNILSALSLKFVQASSLPTYIFHAEIREKKIIKRFLGYRIRSSAFGKFFSQLVRFVCWQIFRMPISVNISFFRCTCSQSLFHPYSNCIFLHHFMSFASLIKPTFFAKRFAKRLLLSSFNGYVY